MIDTTLDELAEITGGAVHGDGAIVLRRGVSVDSRSIPAEGLFVAVGGERVDGHDFAQAAMAAGAAGVLASRPVDAPCVVVDDVVVALGQLARAMVGRLDVVVVGLTGSQGKTSVKDLLAHLLEHEGPTVAPQGSFNNELGVPLTILRADAATRFLVIEMGARGVGHIETLCGIAAPDIGLVLNVGTAHLGEFGSPAGIAAAKGELVEALPADGVAVLNADDPLVAAMASRTSARVVTFGSRGDVRLTEVSLDATGEPSFTLSAGDTTVRTRVPQVGAHQAVNAAAAAAVALQLGMPLERVAALLPTAQPRSPLRMARERRADGLLVLNDAYNANPESVAAALQALASIAPDRGVAVLGAMLELGETSDAQHVRIGRLAAELGVRRVVVVGDRAAGIVEGAGSRAVLVSDVDEAVRNLSASLRPDEVVLVKASRGERLERVADALLGTAPPEIDPRDQRPTPGRRKDPPTR